MKKKFKLKSMALMSLFTGFSALTAAHPQIIQAQQGIEQEMSNTQVYRAYFPNKDIARKTVISLHANLLESHLDKGYLILELTTQEKSRLKPFGYRFEKADAFIEQRNSRLAKIQKQLKIDLAQTSATDDAISLQSIPGYSCYQTVEETFSVMQSMVADHANLASLIDVGDSWQKTQNSGGYDIQVLKLTNSATTGAKPILFINSAIHAREYTTAPLTIEFARWLLDGYGVNADATWILDHHEVHLMLHTNPDGRKQAETGLSWRKNTNQNYCGSSSNSRGADLNRNFSFTWNITNGQGSSGSECSDTYRGPFAASEPEIQALENYVRSIFADKRGPNDSDAAPDDTSGMHLDIHSYSELVLWPWGATNQAAPNGTALQTLGRKFAFFNGYTPQQSIGLYPTDGTSDAVSYGELGVPAFTFELGTSFFQSCSVFENTIVPDNLPALVYAAKVLRTPYVTPGGPDITNITINGSSNEAFVAPGENATLLATANDARFNSSNGSEATQNISAVEYYIDTAPWSGGASANVMAAADGNFNNKQESATGTIDTTGLSMGKHLVYVRAKDTTGVWGAVTAIFLNISDVIPPDDKELSNGVTKSNLSGDKGSDTRFFMQVPANASGLNFQLSGGSGDADLYVRFGSEPTSSSYDCRPFKNGNSETCTISNVQAGTYHVMLTGYAAYSGTNLTGSYQISTGSNFENTTDYNIPDNNATGVTSAINVTRSGASNTVNVEVDIIHTYIGDLVIDLIAPDGSSHNLQSRSGGSANNISTTYSVNLGNVDSLGNWQLKVTDRAGVDTGYIDRWKLNF